MNSFRETFPSQPTVVYVDQFNLILFFIYHHDWNWQFARYSGSNAAVPAFQIYRVSKGTKQFLLVRDLTRWNADVRDLALYTDLASVIRSQALPSITTFCIRQFPQPPDNQKNSALKNQIIESASAVKLCVNEPSLVTTLTTYIELTDGPCNTKLQSRLPSAPLLLKP